MYVEYFKLNGLPFSLNPDPRFVYWSPEHARARARMRSASTQPGGCLIVTGSAGVGKTLLLQTLFSACPNDLIAAQVNQPLESVDEFLQAVLIQLEGVAPVADAHEPLRVFSDFLARQYANGHKVLLIVDEGHGLGPDLLSSVLHLAGCNAPYAGDLRVVIAGESQLSDQLAAAARAQRVPARCEQIVLGTLSHTDVLPYIDHRLSVAGAKGRSIFQASTVDTLFSYTGGNPRRINILCDAALAIACARNSGMVTLAEIRNAVDELHWTPERATDWRAKAEQERPAIAEASSTAQAPHEVKPRATPATLYVALNGAPVTQVELNHGRTRIGRAPDNDLCIDSQFVSRHHCQVLTSPKGSLILDVSSTNGVYMYDKPVRRHWLRNGDVLMVGDYELRYTEPRDQDSPVT